MENNNVIIRGMQAAKQAAQEEGMTGKVEELASRMGVSTGQADEDNDGTPLAARDGVRYDYDDASDLS